MAMNKIKETGIDKVELGEKFSFIVCIILLFVLIKCNFNKNACDSSFT